MPRDGNVSGGGGGTLRSKPQTLEAELTRLEGLDAAGLGEAWQERHGSPPPGAPLCPAVCSVWRSLTTCRRMSSAD